MKFYVCGECNEIATHGRRYTRDFVIDEFPDYCYSQHNSKLVTDIETYADAKRWLAWVRGETTTPPWEVATVNE